MDSYKQVFQALEKANVRYIIVGGVAMNLLGCPRFTNDIDIVLALDEKNLSAHPPPLLSMQAAAAQFPRARRATRTVHPCVIP